MSELPERWDPRQVALNGDKRTSSCCVPARSWSARVTRPTSPKVLDGLEAAGRAGRSA